MEGPFIGLMIVVELLPLGIVAVRAAFQILTEYKLRLVPMNAQRHRIANALVRFSFEMGTGDSNTMSIAADAGMDMKKNTYTDDVMGLLHVGKICTLGAVFKAIGKFYVPVYIMT